MERAARRAPVRNQLLERLPRARRAHVLSGCEHVNLVTADSLAEPGGEMRNVYFPAGSSISILLPMGAALAPEALLAGNEGFYGIAVALGRTVSPVHARVEGSGGAWRMGAHAFRRELARTPALRDCVDRYIFVTMAQLMRNSGCNRFHVVLQRVARRLLMASDRAHSPTFRLTHEFLAGVLGVRRVGVTVAASLLQKRKLIDYSRGTVTILDRAGLERASCACYRDDIDFHRRYLS